MEEEKITLREIKVANRAVADSLLALLDAGADFTLLAQQSSSVNPDGGRAVWSFSKEW